MPAIQHNPPHWHVEGRAADHIKQRQFDLPTEIMNLRLFEEQSRHSLPVCALTVLAQRHHVARRVSAIVRSIP